MKKKGINLRKFLVLLLIAVLVVIGLTSIFYAKFKIAHYQEYDMLLKVVEDKSSIGIGIIPGMIYFGKMSYGSRSIQKIEILHNYKEPLLVQISASGDMGGWITVSENNFIIEKDSKKIVEVIATVPEGASTGNHTGKLKVYLKRI